MPARPWQQLEQALLLVGTLKHDQFQELCIPLLRHERPEVLVTASWLLHLMPRPAISILAAAEAKKKWTSLAKEEKMTQKLQAAYSLQLGFLFHVGAYTNEQQMLDISMAQLDKFSPLTTDSRAIAVWSVGMLRKDSMDEELVQNLVSRVFDDGVPPEFEEVKAGAALAIGLVGSTSAVSSLQKAHAKYGIDGMVGRSVSTAQSQLGQTPPALPDYPPTNVVNWPLTPLREE